MSTEIYCTPQLPAIYLKPIMDTRPPEYFLTPKYKRWAADFRSRRRRRTTFKQRMRDCWHDKVWQGSAEAALAAMHRRKR